MIFNGSGDLLMWYKGLGEISIVNVKSWDEIRLIENVSGKPPNTPQSILNPQTTQK